MPLGLTNEIIGAAVEGFEAQKRRIDMQISELRSIRTGAMEPPAQEHPRPRRKMSAAGRKAIADAQRKRWTAEKAGEGASKKNC